MKIFIYLSILLLSLSSYANQLANESTPEQDIKIYRQYLTNKFPNININTFINGVYALDQNYWDGWRSLEEFPSYLPMIEAGQEIWQRRFQNGQSYASCFNNNPAQIPNFPHWDSTKQQVVTLPLRINECRKENGLKQLPYMHKEIIALSAYMAKQSRGHLTNILIPDNDKALNAYNAGKTYYFSRRGQLNLSCAQCHLESAGQHLRSEVLSPSLGHTSGWPSYRSEWGELGSLHRRFQSCNQAINAKPLAAQSQTYRNLEFFLTYMSNGLEYNGPSTRK